ncbi:Hypothetical protein CINCED_3A013890 [Cinara cedri]|nr:Hypothetical protein CINCED_3A013890 [Cinara cedri]
MFVVDNDVAKDISDTICTHLTRSYDSKLIKLIEANPGVCLITRHILEKTNNNIHVFENNNNEFLAAVHSVFGNRINITKSNFLLLWKYGYQDRMDYGDRISKILSGLGTPQPWNLERPSFQIIAALPSRKFLNYLIYSFMFQTGLMTYGRPEFYLLLQPSVFTRYSSKPIIGEMYYKTQTILFQTIFDLELLKTYPRTAFFPLQSLKSTSKFVRFKELKELDNKFMVLVKVTGRKNLLEKEDLTIDLLKPFWYFVKHHTLSRKNFVIPMLEQWIPGCGPHFIAQGYTTFTQFGDLTPSQILYIFLKFVNLPEYKDSPFISAMESRISKLSPSVPTDNSNYLQSTNDSSLDLEECDSKNV